MVGISKCEPYDRQVEASPPATTHKHLVPNIGPKFGLCGFIKSQSAVVMFWSFGCRHILIFKVLSLEVIIRLDR